MLSSQTLSRFPWAVIGRKFGVCDLGQEVINYISHATKQRLQNLLEKVSEVAQQKNLTFKVLSLPGPNVLWSTNSFFPILFSLFSSLPTGPFLSIRKMNGLSRSPMCERSSNSLSSWTRWRSKGKKSRREKS